MCLAVDLELGEHTIELLCVVGSLRPHSIYATRMGRQSPGKQGRVGCNQDEIISSDPIDPIPYTLYPIVFISYSSISYISGRLTVPLVFVDRRGGLAQSDLSGVLPIGFFMRRRGVLATG